MYQEALFEDAFNLIEPKFQGVYAQMYFRIQYRNLDEDVIQMPTIHTKILFAAELGNHIQEVCAIAL